MALPDACLIYGWSKSNDAAYSADWREKLPKLTVRLLLHGNRVTRFRVMRSKLRNITITLDEALARWGRIEAARQDVSVSRLLADLLRAQTTDQEEYDQALHEALAREPFFTSTGPYLTREEAHDRNH